MEDSVIMAAIKAAIVRAFFEGYDVYQNGQYSYRAPGHGDKLLEIISNKIRHEEIAAEVNKKVQSQGYKYVNKIMENFDKILKDARWDELVKVRSIKEAVEESVRAILKKSKKFETFVLGQVCDPKKLGGKINVSIRVSIQKK